MEQQIERVPVPALQSCSRVYLPIDLSIRTHQTMRAAIARVKKAVENTSALIREEWKALK